jgi:molecular chaperone GrpE
MTTIKSNDDGGEQVMALQASEQTPGEHAQVELARLREENKRLKEEMRREREAHLRNLADFDNYHRRVERERASATREGKRDLMLSLLEVVDDFERLLERSGERRQIESVEFRAIYERLAGLLSAQGVTAFESRGQRFDPTRHEAVGVVEDSDATPGTVIEEISRGYCWGAELLRPARVRVAQVGTRKNF